MDNHLTDQVKSALSGKLGNHPDPEGDRLMREVMDAAEDLERAWGEVGRKPITDRDDFASRRLQRATKAYADHRTKAAPELVPELLPCPFCGGEAKGQRDVMSEDWEVACMACGMTLSESCEAAGTAKWNTRHSVASPALPDKRAEPTDEAINAWLSSLGDDASLRAIPPWLAWKLVRAALTYFATPIIPGEPKPELLGDAQGCCDMGAACSCRGKPSLRAGCCFWTDAESLQPATPNDSINSQLEQEKAPRPAAPHPSQSATQHAVEIFRQGFRPHESTESFVLRIMDCDDRPATPTINTRIPVTDEALDAFRTKWINTRAKGAGHSEYQRALLAHFSNPITGEGEA